MSLALEFLANWPNRKDGVVKKRGKEVSVLAKDINDLYSLPTFAAEHQELNLMENNGGLNMIDVAEMVGFLGLRFYNNDTLYRCELNPVARVWVFFVSGRMMPSKHFSDVQIDHLKIVYAIVKGYNLNVEAIIKNSFEMMV